MNLALEEYLLKNYSEDYIILYRNEPSLIVGKHQNSMAEINYLNAYEKNIPVYRRISGGGTVYQDLGNLNFSFIHNVEGQNMVDFKKYTTPVLDFLKSLNLNVSLGKRNELMIGDQKISGNAEHVYRNRVLHHGTLLFESDLNELNELLKVDILLYRDRSKKSVRSVVSNIKDYLNNIEIEEFISKISKFLRNYLIASEFNISADTLQEIETLANEKYRTWEWNFGYNPAYVFEKLQKIDGIGIVVKVEAEKGIIQSVEFDSLPNKVFESLSEIDFKGLAHSFNDIRSFLDSKEIFQDKDQNFVNCYVKLFF